jgi:alkylation response protein AidB-like acyl-CoA dehydrogenase
MSRPEGFDLADRARALAPLITRDADEIERTRRLTPAVTSALIENGLYRALLPKSLGGTEATLQAFMQMQEEVAKADASTAWCLGQCSVCAMTAAYLDRDAAEEIFNAPPGILAWGAIAHEVKVVAGGYIANARWDFASGSRQASWLGAHVRVVEADGTPRRKADGSPEIRTILFPVSSATMYDVWDVIGLKGTGTDSYSVENLSFRKNSQPCATIPARCASKARSTSSTNMVFSMGFAATALGVARNLDAAIELARQDAARSQGDARQQRSAGPDRPHRGILARARVPISTLPPTRSGETSRGDQITEQHRVALRITATWTIHQSASVVDTAYHMAGATAVFAANQFERRFRDMHAIAQQIQARDTHYEDAGKAILSANLDAAPTAR